MPYWPLHLHIWVPSVFPAVNVLVHWINLVYTALSIALQFAVPPSLNRYWLLTCRKVWVCPANDLCTLKKGAEQKSYGHLVSRLIAVLLSLVWTWVSCKHECLLPLIGYRHWKQVWESGCTNDDLRTVYQQAIVSCSIVTAFLSSRMLKACYLLVRQTSVPLLLHSKICW